MIEKITRNSSKQSKEIKIKLEREREKKNRVMFTSNGGGVIIVMTVRSRNRKVEKREIYRNGSIVNLCKKEENEKRE